MKQVKTNAEIKCYLCGKKECLYYINFCEFVCLKDKERFNRFIHRLKKRRTRTTVEALIKKYSEKNGGNGEQKTGSQ